MVEMKDYFSRERLKNNAKMDLKGNWAAAILVCVISIIIIDVPTIFNNKLGFIDLILGGPISLGVYYYFLKLSRNETGEVEDVFHGFKYFTTALIAYLLYLLYVFLWTLVFIVPGIIASLSYSQIFYILADNPDIPASEALKISKDMMKGYKWDYFVLQLSFLGWALLSIVTAGIGFLWLIPYVKATNAHFYLKAKENYNPLNYQTY
ncbi:DUF975 family protein [Clostridium polynesiense]|uniref:DUF975 family protein n=1 Tax=Clostridium polynesiense TaxID=1325933 RepID=UPI00069461B9|nr:DUF975 family protein [Clostridium polynesiense]